jgi:hypothetical protein
LYTPSNKKIQNKITLKTGPTKHNYKIGETFTKSKSFATWRELQQSKSRLKSELFKAVALSAVGLANLSRTV